MIQLFIHPVKLNVNLKSLITKIGKESKYTERLAESQSIKRTHFNCQTKQQYWRASVRFNINN